ncbi:MAG TPA: carbohydrate ABC transporter permease [Sphaerochaeta sp.]|nr:carbohydrate ABC transporter permease [Sphaerochaeta sp.]
MSNAKLKTHTKKRHIVTELFAVILSGFLYGIPFVFIVFNSLKTRKEAGLMRLSFPNPIQFNNYAEIFGYNDFIVMRSFFNSIFITALSIVLLTVVCSLAGFVLQRRKNKPTNIVNALFLAGLMLPPTILPTIWVMDFIGIYRSLFGMVLVEVALNIPFTVMLYRAYVGTVPLEIEEAAVIDGCPRSNMFCRIVFPLLKPVSSTVIVLNAVTIFNDFVNPLYFLPGAKNSTVQLTLNMFMGRFGSSWHLLFADVVLITLPPLVLFIFFNKKIVDGMTAGAIKG